MLLYINFLPFDYSEVASYEYSLTLRPFAIFARALSYAKIYNDSNHN